MTSQEKRYKDILRNHEKRRAADDHHLIDAAISWLSEPQRNLPDKSTLLTRLIQRNPQAAMSIVVEIEEERSARRAGNLH